MATVVIASLNGARDKAKSAAIKSEARQLFNLAMEHYAETGDFTNFVTSGDWVRGDTQSEAGSITCSDRFRNTPYKSKAVEICNSITLKLPTNRAGGGSHNKLLIGCQGNCTDLKNRFSITVKLQDNNSVDGKWFCIGTSGIVAEYSILNENDAGCFQNP